MARTLQQASSKSPLRTRVAILRAFVTPSRQRGDDYYERGRVRGVRAVGGHGVVARVEGSRAYLAEVHYDHEMAVLEVFCDCPFVSGYDEPCKHIWALLRHADEKGLLSDARNPEEVDLIVVDEPSLEATPSSSTGLSNNERKGAAQHYAGEDEEENEDDDAEVLISRARGALSQWLGGDDEDEVEELIARAEGDAPGPRNQGNLLDQLIASGRAGAGRTVVGPQKAPTQKLVAVLDMSLGPHAPVAVTIMLKRRERLEHVASEDLLGYAAAGTIDADMVLIALRGEEVVYPQPMWDRLSFVDTARDSQRCDVLLPVLLPDKEAAATLKRFAQAERLLALSTVSDASPSQTGDVIQAITFDRAKLSLKLAIEVDAEEAGYRIRPQLETKAGLIQPESVRFAHSCGVAIVEGALMVLASRSQAEWLALLHEQGEPLVLGADELEEFLERYYESPHLPQLSLPGSLTLEPQEVTPIPFADIGAKDGESSGLPIAAGLRYGNKEVSLRTTGGSVVDLAGNARYIRDPDYEEERRGELESLGARFARWYPAKAGKPQMMEGYRIAIKRTNELAVGLVRLGWSVSLERKRVRPLTGFSLHGKSGVDWLEIAGTAQFGDDELPLGELLRALRRRQRRSAMIELDTSGIGVVESELVEKLERMLDLGAAVDRGNGTLRLGRVHAGAAFSLLDGAVQCSEDASLRKLRHCLESGALPTAMAPPRGFCGQLREYQRVGLGWLTWLERAGFGGCLADDMGLGKTVQVLALLMGRPRRRGPALIVAPRSVLSNWIEEAHRFAPTLKAQMHWGSERSKQADELQKQKVVVTTYATLARDLDLLSSVEWDYVVLDEAQAIKNRSTQAATTVRELSTKHRIALTGTPIENHLDELWALLDFLNPGFGAKSPAKSGALSGSDQALVSAMIKPFILRRTKRQVAPELPERVEQTLHIELSRAERRRYDELHRHFRREYSDALTKLGIQRSTPILLTSLLRLRQAACHQGLIDDAQRKAPSSKLNVLIDRLEELKSEGSKALVFSQFTEHLNLVEPHLKSRQIGFVRLDGKTTRRQERIEAFQTDPEVTVFLISLKAGGTGLNLTAAEYVFLLDPWWNPAAEAQAIDRCHRIGQTQKVVAYRLIATGTVEEKVTELQRRKRELVASVLGDEKAFFSQLTREDLVALLE